MKPRNPLTPAQAAEAEKQRLEWAAEVDWLAETLEKQAEAVKPARVFDETFLGEDGSMRYDFEVCDGMSVREWNAAHPDDRIPTTMAKESGPT